VREETMRRDEREMEMEHNKEEEKFKPGSWL
jgi:hypothetical protein